MDIRDWFFIKFPSRLSQIWFDPSCASSPRSEKTADRSPDTGGVSPELRATPLAEQPEATIDAASGRRLAMSPVKSGCFGLLTYRLPLRLLACTSVERGVSRVFLKLQPLF